MAGDCTLTMGGKRIWVICYFLLCTGGETYCFLLSDMSLTLVIVAQVFGLSVCCV